ncbi:MAG: hypothetical protein C6Y22_24470 [Hapalosiphonaceae cyanobacterium JJU2]|nr:MAG: hypothetical protein C6Y22_24470 [Hapalosiphonaceae cyanobacterium JJU2]
MHIKPAFLKLPLLLDDGANVVAKLILQVFAYLGGLNWLKQIFTKESIFIHSKFNTQFFIF